MNRFASGCPGDVLSDVGAEQLSVEVIPTAFSPKSRPCGEHSITEPPPNPLSGTVMLALVASSVARSSSPTNLSVVGGVKTSGRRCSAPGGSTSLCGEPGTRLKGPGGVMTTCRVGVEDRGVGGQRDRRVGDVRERHRPGGWPAPSGRSRSPARGSPPTRSTPPCPGGSPAVRNRCHCCKLHREIRLVLSRRRDQRRVLHRHGRSSPFIQGDHGAGGRDAREQQRVGSLQRAEGDRRCRPRNSWSSRATGWWWS